MGLERTILNQVKTQIQNVNGAGSYVNDVSGSDAVVIGATFAPHRVPGVYLYPNGVSSSQSGGSTVLTRYDRTMSVQVECWRGATNSQPGTALLDALDFQDDVMRALEADRSLGNNVRDIEIAGASYDGAELDRPGLGLAVLLLTIKYTETAGV